MTPPNREAIERRVEQYGMAYKGILPDDAIERSKEHWRNELLDVVDEMHTLLIERVEGMKERLVVDNWEDGKAKVCNPRCHDSGKEQALDDVLAILTDAVGGKE